MADKTFVQADWLEKNKLSESYIKNKPSIEPQKNADWNEASYWSPAYIRNKPNIKKLQSRPQKQKQFKPIGQNQILENQDISKINHSSKDK
jgi:hypothetical protein